MEVALFEEIQEEFMSRVSQAVYCAMATIDRKNCSRLRIMHPIWDGPSGWVISHPQSHKAKHLQHNPAVSLAYIRINRSRSMWMGLPNGSTRSRKNDEQWLGPGSS